MPATPVLCRYQYDPLDRLAACAQPDALQAQRFYLKNRQTTEVEGLVRRSIFQHADVLLAEQRHTGQGADTSLLATDQQRSVLQVANTQGVAPLVHMPYGHRTGESGLLSLLGFNGERPDPLTGHYLLGNGYRAFNPVLMRFHSPDSLSPFGRGGLNTYAYCVGDPINRSDPTGHYFEIIERVAKLFGRRSSRSRATARVVGANASPVSPQSSRGLQRVPSPGSAAQAPPLNSGPSIQLGPPPAYSELPTVAGASSARPPEVALPGYIEFSENATRINQMNVRLVEIDSEMIVAGVKKIRLDALRVERDELSWQIEFLRDSMNGL